jgi:transcriptional regulator with XRE-family HTH domain
MDKEQEQQILRLFADRVRAHREAIGLSQEKLAEQAGLHRTYIGSIERAEKIPSLITIIKIARALRIENSQLMDF